MDFPLINGHRYSFSSLVARFDGQPAYIDFSEISYSHKLEPGEVRGTPAQLLGTTRGEYSAEGSVTMTKECWDAFRNHLGNGYLEKRWPLVASYAEDGLPVVTDEMTGVRITSVETKPSKDGVAVTLSLHITYLLEGGKQPLNSMRL